MSFPPTVGARYLTAEGRIWVVDSVSETGLPRSVRLTTENRSNLDIQEVLEEEWDDFEATARLQS